MRDLSSIATKDLTPADLSNPVSCWAWAILYSAIHLGLVATLHFQIFEVFSREYYVAFFLLVGLPFILLPELYVRTIWVPYRREMMRRGGVPKRDERRHPFDIERKLAGYVLFFSLICAWPPISRFILFNYESLSLIHI